MTDELIRRDAAIAACRYDDAHDCRDAINDLPAVTVGVKPLVWHEGDEPDEWKSGPYDVWCELGRFQLYYWFKILGEPHETAEAAKDAAYKHHRARILAALTPTAVDTSQTADPAAYNRGYEDCLYQRGDAPDPAAIREAAAVVEREIELAKSLMPMVVPILRGVHRNILAIGERAE